MYESVVSMAAVMLVLIAANVFSYYLSWERIPQALSVLLIETSKNKYLFLLFVNVLLLILGMFLDGMATMIILAPLLAPVATALGIDLVHFGLVMCLNCAIGAITPPFGTYIFLVSGTVKIKTDTLIKELLPFIGVCIVVLALVTYIPWFTHGHTQSSLLEEGTCMFDTDYIRSLCSLEGKNAIITGGNQGIGKGIAYSLAKLGALVTIVGRNPTYARRVFAHAPWQRP